MEKASAWMPCVQCVQQANAKILRLVSLAQDDIILYFCVIIWRVATIIFATRLCIYTDSLLKTLINLD